MQKHAARQLHWDLRLEMDGVLVSWAVPKGPSADPDVKRLAMRVEEHPIEYADFEGHIPDGEYGAGAVVVWDRGLWVPVKDPKHGLEQGKLLFDLHGYKLRGRWTLFETREDRHWILMKKPDAHAGDDREWSEASIFSGRFVEEMKAGKRPGPALRKRIRRAGADRGDVALDAVRPMLAAIADGPFDRKGWGFEIKFDGYRLLGGTGEEGPYLRTRSGRDARDRFPELVTALRAMPYRGLVLDGECVALDPSGRPSFGMLQGRVGRRGRAALRASVAAPVTWFVFDLLAAEGFDLRPLPLDRRRRLLRSIVPPVGPIRFVDQVATRGRAAFERIRALGLEGLIAKRADAPYVEGRSESWLKVRADREDAFAVAGVFPERGRTERVGSLHLAARAVDGGWRWVGKVGSGLDRSARRHWSAAVREGREEPTVSGVPREARAGRWVEPQEGVRVRFKEWSAAARLRQPVYLGAIGKLEPDRSAACPATEDDWAAVAAETAGTDRANPGFTNVDKTFWPDDGLTKGDLLSYYETVADAMLPWLQDRPAALVRHPDGIDGKWFYQKDAPGFAPSWLRTETVWSESASREISHFVIDDARTLLWLANLGTIPFHVWTSRCERLSRPDWCVLDLDPKGAPLTDVVTLARALHRWCDRLGLPHAVKTSGSTGLHVFVALGARYPFETSKLLARLLAKLVVQEHAGIATIARTRKAREGKVYVDAHQNGHGKLIVAPFSVRALPGAPVSTPLRWSEVTKSLDLAKYSLRTVPARLKKMRTDPWASLREPPPDLEDVMARLEASV